jgi:2-polyprenyl-6-methoxyphenol hydroxylase-like FAD-dependent oxidoreductase
VTWSPRRTYDAVVVGGAVAGLTVALLLARRGASVAVLERDHVTVPPRPADAWSRWRRPGVPHLRHLHAYRARLRALLERELPDVLDAMLAAGAAEIPLTGRSSLLAADRDLVTLACRRSTYECVLLQAACREPGIAWFSGRDVARVLTGGDRTAPAVTGVACSDGTVVGSPLVVDASGRAPSLAARLGASALPAPREDRVPGSMRYFCRYYAFRRADAWHAQVGFGRRFSGRTLRVGIYLAEPPLFAVGMTARAADPSARMLRDGERFEAVAAAVPSVASAIRPDVASPVSGVFSMGSLPAYARRYAPGEPATGYLLLGDALMAVNPAYGRGITMATLTALLLADAVAESRGDLGAAAAATVRDVASQVEPWYRDSVARDELYGEWRCRCRSCTAGGDESGPAPAADHYRAALRISHMLDIPAAPIDGSALAERIVDRHEGTEQETDCERVEGALEVWRKETAGSG